MRTAADVAVADVFRCFAAVFVCADIFRCFFCRRVAIAVRFAAAVFADFSCRRHRPLRPSFLSRRFSAAVILRRFRFFVLPMAFCFRFHYRSSAVAAAMPPDADVFLPLPIRHAACAFAFAFYYFYHGGVDAYCCVFRTPMPSASDGVAIMTPRRFFAAAAAYRYCRDFSDDAAADIFATLPPRGCRVCRYRRLPIFTPLPHFRCFFAAIRYAPPSIYLRDGSRQLTLPRFSIFRRRFLLLSCRHASAGDVAVFFSEPLSFYAVFASIILRLFHGNDARSSPAATASHHGPFRHAISPPTPPARFFDRLPILLRRMSPIALPRFILISQR